MLGDESNKKAIKISLEATKLTSDILVKVIKYLASDKYKLKHGQQNFKDLYRKGKELDNVPVDNKDIKEIKKQLKKSHVDFAVNKSEKGLYEIYFKGQDVEHIKEVLQKYMNNKMKEKTPIKTRLEKAAVKSKAYNAARDMSKLKNKRREYEGR